MILKQRGSLVMRLQVAQGGEVGAEGVWRRQAVQLVQEHLDHASCHGRYIGDVSLRREADGLGGDVQLKRTV